MSSVPEGHDTYFHIFRVEALADAIRNGQFRLYVAPDVLDRFGYGISLFYSDFFIYLPALLVCVGLKTLTAYRILLIFICCITVINCWYMGYEVTKNDTVALVCSAFIVFSNYFYTDVFVRNAIGESLAFAFVPMAVAGIYNLFYGDYKKWWQVALGFAGLAMSHVLSFVVMCILFAVSIAMYLIYELLVKRSKISLVPKFVALVKAVVAVVLASAWFTLPMLEQMLTTQYLSSYFARIYNPMQSALRVRNVFFIMSKVTVFSPVLGKGVLAYLVGWCVYFVANTLKKKNSETDKFLFGCILVAGMTIAGSTSLFPWQRLDPYLNMIQYPWRLHLFSTILISLAGSYGIVQLFDRLFKDKKVYPLLLIVLIGRASFNVSAIKLYTNSRTMDLSNSYDFYDENYLHINTDRKIFADRKNHADKIRTTKGGAVGSCEYVPYGVHKVTFSGNKGRENKLEMPINYYYGYKVTDESGKALDTFPSDSRGWLSVNIDGYDSQILTVTYGGTPIQKISLAISTVFYILLLAYLPYRSKRQLNK